MATTIEHVYRRLRLLVAEFAAGRPYEPAVDPFSFDYSPRTELDSFYLDPPATSSEGFVGGVEQVVASFSIWLSRDAGQDAQGAAVALAGDLALLRHLVVTADLDPDQELAVDVNMHQGARTEVAPRGEGEVAAIGRLALQVDYETDGENP